MRLNVLSDLHLRRGILPVPENDADVAILAGDIAGPHEAIAWAAGFRKPVVYVPGNHEFYGGSIAGTVAELRMLCAGTRIHVLDADELTFDGVRFLGTTLWTDYRLAGNGALRAAAMREAQQRMHDFTRIRTGDEGCFTPADAAALFEVQSGWLERKLDEPFSGPTVVVTHHAPSTRSIHPRFAGSPLNPGFIAMVEHLLDGRAGLWIHGHTHDSFDYRHGGTRVVCNPRGYSRDGVDENPRFDPNLVVDVI